MKKINYQKGESDLGLIIIVLIGLFLIWLMFGGVERVEDQSLFIDDPIDTMIEESYQN